MYSVACYLVNMLSHLQFGLNNLREIDLTLLPSSYLSLTVVETNLLLEGLSEPSVKYKCSTAVYGQ